MPFTTIYGGSPSTRIIGSASSIQQTLHPAVMDYINAMQSPIGGNYAMSINEIDAVNQLVCSLETNGLWSKMDLVYPFIGNSLSAMKYNLKNTSQYNIAFTGTAFTLSTANGFAKTATDTTSYGSIPFNVRNLLSGSSNHISCYLGTSQAGVVTPFGSYSGTVESFRILSSTGFFGVQLGSSSGNINLAVTGTTGYIIGSRTSLSNASMYVGGVVRVNNTTTVPSTNLPNFANIGLGMSLSGTAYPSTQAIRFATIGSGLTDIEAKNLSTIVQIYQTKLSRQV
jgi:hypothetical protein